MAKDFNRHFTKDTQIQNKHMKNTQLICILEIQPQVTMRYHHTHTILRPTRISHTHTCLCVYVYIHKHIFIYIHTYSCIHTYTRAYPHISLVESKTALPLWKSLVVPHQAKHTFIQPSISSLGIYPSERKIHVHTKNYM